MFKILLIPLILLSGCASSIRLNESSSRNVVIWDHFLTGNGQIDVNKSATNYCRQFGAEPVLVKKKDGCLLGCGSEYHEYYFDCEKKLPTTQIQTIPPTNPIIQNAPNTSQLNSLSIEDAKKKCLDLGFKTGTEQFGKCVLQISK